MITNSSSLPDLFAWMIESLCRSIAAEGHKRRLDGPLVVAIWNRVRRLGRRFASVVARLRAGKLPLPGSARRRPASPRPASPRAEAAPCPPGMLPRNFAWTHRLLPESAPGAAGMVYQFLEHPEIRALYAAAPQLGRILRPYCSMLGVRPPAWLALPRRPRVRKKKSTPPPSSTSLKPADTRKLSRLTLVRLSRPPGDALCPPLAISYGRPRAPPKNPG